MQHALWNSTLPKSSVTSPTLWFSRMRAHSHASKAVLTGVVYSFVVFNNSQRAPWRLGTWYPLPSFKLQGKQNGFFVSHLACMALVPTAPYMWCRKGLANERPEGKHARMCASRRCSNGIEREIGSCVFSQVSAICIIPTSIENSFSVWLG